MTSTTSQIISDVATHYNNLIVNHRKLDREITEAHDKYLPDQHIKSLKLNKLHTEIEHCQYYAPDDNLKTLKKKKLRLKDEIEQLKNHLTNLTK